MDRSALTEFYVSCEPHNWGVGRPEESHNTLDRPLYIGGYSGDRILAETEFPGPDLVKVDVEGFEYEVLVGMQEQLRQADSISLVFELSEYRYTDRSIAATEVLELMQSLGFNLYKLGTGGRVRPFETSYIYGDVVATKDKLL